MINVARRRDENRRRDNTESLVDIPDNAEIRITNDHNGRYVLVHPTLTQLRIDLHEAGAEEWIMFKSLRAIQNSQPADFQNMKLMITGVRNATKEVVYTKDDKKVKKKVPIEIKDVVQSLGLTRFYEAHKELLPTKHGEAPDGIDIEDFVLDSEIEDFEALVKRANPSFKFKLADAALGLYEEGKFSNKVKMSIIEESLNATFFESVDLAAQHKRERKKHGVR